MRSLCVCGILCLQGKAVSVFVSGCVLVYVQLEANTNKVGIVYPY